VADPGSAASVLWRLRGKAAAVIIVTPPRGTVCPSDRLPFDPEFRPASELNPMLYVALTARSHARYDSAGKAE
jgi:hypothetical protein